MEFADIGPDDFASKESVTNYFVEYAKMINAPIQCGVEVESVERLKGRAGFQVETSDGSFEAKNIVSATGAFQSPVIPPIVPQDAPVKQLHSIEYRNPEQLPEGAVLVVGAGSSGSQIAEELMLAGRQVYLSVGPHDRPPRSYRGMDFCWWLGVLGLWDIAALAPGTEHVTIAVSGANGGRTVDFRRFAEGGMTLTGLTQTYKEGVLTFAADLSDNIAGGDANYLSMLDQADAYVARNGIDLPEEPDARKSRPDPDCMINPVRALNLVDAGVSSIIWATGFARDYGWLKVDAFEEAGAPRHQRGVSSEPGVYFLGLPWQSRRGSTFIWGVWHDAKHLADHITNQRKYLDYHAATHGNR